jgi:hypothetical protein
MAIASLPRVRVGFLAGVLDVTCWFSSWVGGLQERSLTRFANGGNVWQ